MYKNIIASSGLHFGIIILATLSWPFLSKKPIDLPPLISVELIQITDQTNIPFATKAKKIIEKYNVLLAGGLNPVNIQSITQELNPWGVDVSSGVETDGVKDKDKIEDFILSVKGVKY